jgi:hypothetical protein
VQSTSRAEQNVQDPSCIVISSSSAMIFPLSFHGRLLWSGTRRASFGIYLSVRACSCVLVRGVGAEERENGCGPSTYLVHWRWGLSLCEDRRCIDRALSIYVYIYIYMNRCHVQSQYSSKQDAICLSVCLCMSEARPG